MSSNKRLLNLILKTSSKKRKLNEPTSAQKEKETEKEDQKEVDEEKLSEEKLSEEEEDEDDEEEDEEDQSYDEDYEDEEDYLEKEIGGDSNLNERYKVIKKEVLRNEPNAKDLLTLPMRTEDRARLSLYFENYKSHIPYSVEWIESRDTYNKLLKEFTEGYKYYEQYSDADIKKFDIEESKFKMFNPQLALKYKILNLNTSHSNKEVIYKKYNELINMETSDDEYGKTKNWLTWATDIPHNTIKEINIDLPTEFICRAKKILDNELYGMENVKEQIILFLSSKIKSPDLINTNLALLGPPGTGKTSIARLISKIMDWGFTQISFGGIEKPDFLKGHEYTYVGSGPGEIVKSLKKLKCKNGIIFLDELDKISDNPELNSALLHIIDPTQNMDFRDMFLSEISIDLSKIWWVSSLNTLPSDSALTDRWSVIKIDGYNYEDKINIVQDYLLPKSLINSKFKIDDITFSKESIKHFIQKYSKTSDKGVRSIEKKVKDIVSKINFILTHQDNIGKLPFKVSFQLKYKIEIPLIITKDILDTVLSDNSPEIDKLIPFMYI